MVNQLLEAKFVKLSDSPQEHDRLTDLLNGLSIPYALAEDYTYPDMPKIPFLSLNSETGEITETNYSLWNANPAAFMARGTVHNVLSCHSLYRFKEQWAGNLGYICSPYWGNLWLVKTNSTKKAELETEIDCDHSDWPNPITSVNYLLLEKDGHKLIVLSAKRYGDRFNADYRHENTALSIYQATGIPVARIWDEGDRVTVHYHPQVTIGENQVGKRYPDIDEPDAYYDDNNELVVVEEFYVKMLFGEYPYLNEIFGLNKGINRTAYPFVEAEDLYDGEDSRIYCTECGYSCGNDEDFDGEFINDDPYCYSCAADMYSSCVKCSERIGIPDSRNYPGDIQINGETYCESCGREFLAIFFDDELPNEFGVNNTLDEVIEDNDKSVHLYHFIDVDKDGNIIEYVDEYYDGIRADCQFDKVWTQIDNISLVTVNLVPNYIGTERTAQLSFAFSLPVELTWEESIRRMAHT